MPSEPETPGYRYERIMQVSIGHTFYNISGDECHDFTIAPTPVTVELMRSLGLLFKLEEAGFSVLYNKSHEQSLLQYLQRQANQNGQIWTRLSFVLTSTNAYFVNRTNIPINTDAAKDNFFFTNQQAHREPGFNRPRLNPGRYVSIVSRYDVVHGQVKVRVTDDVEEVQVIDISGDVVICKPRCVPRGLLTQIPLAAITCADVERYLKEYPDAPMSCTDNVLYLDMAHLPEDRYTIRRLTKARELVELPWPVVYDPIVPSPLCLIDLLFTNPTGEPTGIYPVTDFNSTTPISPVHYELMFERRSTLWNYYIIPRKWEPIEDLRIIDPEVPNESLFDGPCLVRLANGEKAYRFISKELLPLEQQSRIRFQLQGRRASLLNAPNILMDRLPVSSAQQVLPRQGQTVCDDFCQSEFFPDSPGCKAIKERLCSSLLTQLQNYSDIFVYV